MTTAPLSPVRSAWKLTSPSALLAWALAAFLLLLSAGAAFDPVGAADGFGLPISSADALPWLRIKADRDLGLGLILVALILARRRRLFGVVALVSAVSPSVDALTVIGHGMRSVGYALSVHGSAVLYCLALGSWLLRRSAPAPVELEGSPARPSLPTKPDSGLPPALGPAPR
jgi:Domain of unknown function (DUF4267)